MPPRWLAGGHALPAFVDYSRVQHLLAAGFMALTSRHAPQFRRRASLIWLLVTALLASYAALLDWGPSPSSFDGLRTQVLAQKAAAVVLTGALLLLAREADRVRANYPPDQRPGH